MHLAISILPIALPVALMTLPVARLRMPWPAHIALPIVALLVYGMQLFFLAAYASGVKPLKRCTRFYVCCGGAKHATS